MSLLYGVVYFNSIQGVLAMTVGSILADVGSGITLVLPSFEVILMTAIVLGAVIFIIATLYRRLRR